MQTVTMADFSGNSIGPSGADALFNTVFYYNNVSDQSFAFLNINILLRRTQRITEIYLGNNRIGVAGARNIARGLRNNGVSQMLSYELRTNSLLYRR